MDVGAWLEGLGLGQYAQVFAENHIDGETLRALTAEDVKELGVTSLGHRKRLLAAVAALRRGERVTATAPIPVRAERAPSSYTPPYLAHKILASRSAMEGERKQVTVLFADIKGSLELIADSDPERVRAILDGVIRTMMEAVHRYEGTVNKVLGDGIMALFGAPVAHEDHAVRACYAAFAMQEAMAAQAERTRREHGVEVRLRVGLNSGDVVVRAIGNDLTMDYDAIGQTVHLAGRMEQTGLPGAIRLTGETLRLAEGFVRVRSLGPVPIKGLDQPIEVFELTGAAPMRTRFHAAVARGLTRFVGRDTELEALNRALARAERGQGQIVAVVGEPGVGKSRLFYEFTHSHRTENWLVLESGSVSYGKATAYLPVIDLLKAYFRIDTRDDIRRIREKVTGKLLTLDENLRSALAALLVLMDVPVDEQDWRALQPPQRRRRTLDAVKGLLLRESQVQPVVLVFEDLHWIDSETQAVLDSLVESLPAARILLLVNYRPEYRHGWGGKTYYTQRRIDPLPPESAGELLASLLGDDPGLAGLKRLLITRTEGNPFFVEESVRTVVETGALAGTPGAYRLVEDVGSVRVPVTVQGVLAARIDRLVPEDKRLLQTAAVIGKDVPRVLLQAVADLREEDLDRGSAALQAGEFLYETRLFPDREYTFKHALTHEVAYGSLLQERRAGLHRQIAEAIEATFAGRLAEQSERLAHHYTEAGLAAQAIPYWQQAGERAIERSANTEAIAHLRKGLDLLESLPKTKEHSRQKTMLLLAMGISLQATRGASSPDVGRVYGEARQLCEETGDTSLLFPVLWGLWRCHRTRANLSIAHELAQELLDLARDQEDSTLLLQAHHAQWTTLYYLGKFAAAQDHVDQGVALYSPQEHRKQAFVIAGHDPCVCGQGTAALVLWLSGRPDRALERIDKAVRLARELDQPSSMALAWIESTLVHLFRREPEKVLERAEALLALAAEWDFSEDLTTGEILRGWAEIRQGRSEPAVRRMHDALSARRSAGRTVEESHVLGILAEAFGAVARPEIGLTLLDEGLVASERHGAHYWLAELHRLRGELLLMQSRDNGPEAEACFDRAIGIARNQGVRALELRAATNLARLWQAQGKTIEAREILAPVYEWFTEGLDTADLMDARTLLAELG
ncbi:MAG: adenylate/guanylate cyclase domain-containing protein [Kiloniellaceae bacterium]